MTMTATAGASYHVWDRTEDAYILSHARKMKFTDIAQSLGLTKHQVRGRYLRLTEKAAETEEIPAEESPEDVDEEVSGKPVIQWKGDDNQQVVTIRSSTIRTKEDALKAANIDPTKWDIDHFEVGKHDGFFRSRSYQHDKNKKNDWRRQATVIELWSIKIWLKAKKGPSIQVIRDLCIAEMKQFAPVYGKQPEIVLPSGERFAYELSVPDLHGGKLCWGEETGTNYDTKISRNAFTDAILHLMGRATHLPLEEIWVPIGNDFFNTDFGDLTTAGTPQDTDDRWKKIFKLFKKTVIEVVDWLTEIAPLVRIIIVPGNHDRQKVWYFGDTLESQYHNHDRVIIDNSAPLRKRVEYGANLIGFTHGDEEKHADLPLLMASEWKQEWCRTTHHEWHLGHYHKAKELRYVAGDTLNGVRVRILPSLSGIDAWHYSKGYVCGPRAAEAYLWSRSDGYAGHFNYTIPTFDGKSPASILQAA